MDNQRFGIVGTGSGIAKNAVGLGAACCLFHVLVAPGSPEIVHQLALPRMLRLQNIAQVLSGQWLQDGALKRNAGKMPAPRQELVSAVSSKRGRRRRRLRRQRCSRNLSALCWA